MKLTERERMYAEHILEHLGTDEKPARIEDNEIIFAEPDGQSEFLELVQDEASYDRACGARLSLFPMLFGQSSSSLVR